LNNTQCYYLLGLREGASIPEIRSAYRRLVLEYHPDKNTSAKDGAKFKLITEAYHTLRVKNTNTGRIPDNIYQNQSRTYKKVKSWNFYLNTLHDIVDYQKTVYQKIICQYLPKSKPLLMTCYRLGLQHGLVPLYGLIKSSYIHARSLILRLSYRGLVRGLSRLPRSAFLVCAGRFSRMIHD